MILLLIACPISSLLLPPSVSYYQGNLHKNRMLSVILHTFHLQVPYSALIFTMLS